MLNSHHSFVNYVISSAKAKIKGYCGTLLVDVLYNVQGNAVVVVWSNYTTSQVENYTFPTVGAEDFCERTNNGEDFSQEAEGLINTIFAYMVAVESQQTGRPLVI
ncbi:hypothetical protein GW643_23865 [Serratia marcescens]|uniref:hypothetical protein n=1 Tax=Serratia marcescens TaxID=615 RepID=UPI0013778DE4|nr:hypothetical protein [Serratia marcescens]NCJ13406.1 hypothetical protein [Serratia marcescens]NDJ04609.1 hypothetical protein [Serratia marcescens]